MLRMSNIEAKSNHPNEALGLCLGARLEMLLASRKQRNEKLLMGSVQSSDGIRNHILVASSLPHLVHLCGCANSSTFHKYKFETRNKYSAHHELRYMRWSAILEIPEITIIHIYRRPCDWHLSS